MNYIKYYLWKLGLVKWPTTNMTRLREAQEDYAAAITLIAELTRKLESTSKPTGNTRKRRNSKK